MHAGGVHEICVMPKYNTDDDNNLHGMLYVGLSRAWHLVLQEASLCQVKSRNAQTLLSCCAHSIHRPESLHGRYAGVSSKL